MELGHVHLKVSDLEEAVAFYRSMFGFTESERYDRYVFLRLDDEHHSLALQEVSEDATVGRQQPGLFHVAFEVDNERKLREIYRRCKEEGIRVSPVDHGISRSFYLNDPSGNGIEVYVDTREKTGDSKWKGRNRALNFDEFEGG